MIAIAVLIAVIVVAILVAKTIEGTGKAFVRLVNGPDAATKGMSKRRLAFIILLAVIVMIGALSGKSHGGTPPSAPTGLGIAAPTPNESATPTPTPTPTPTEK